MTTGAEIFVVRMKTPAFGRSVGARRPSGFACRRGFHKYLISKGNKLAPRFLWTTLLKASPLTLESRAQQGFHWNARQKGIGVTAL